MDNLHSIENSNLLKGLSTEQMRAMAEVAREFGVKKGEYLFKLGSEAITLFVVSSGVIRLTLPMHVFGGDKELMVEELSSGKTIAWSALVAPHVLTLSAKATTDAELIGFQHKELLDVFEAKPDLGYRIMTNLALVVGQRLHTTQTMWARELQRFISEKYQ